LLDSDPDLDTVYLNPTKGFVVEDPANNSFGDSFFDVYFEIAITPPPPGMPPEIDTLFLYNHPDDPMRMSAKIDRVPPYNMTFDLDSLTGYIPPPDSCIGLWTDPYDGIQMLSLLHAEHRIFPIPTISQWGLIIFVLLLLSFGAGFIYKQQYSFAGIGNNSKSEISQKIIPFDKKIYFKTLSVISLLAVIVLSILAFYNIISRIDVIGTVISLFILTYILHILVLSRKK
jgi:hypothetical protein